MLSWSGWWLLLQALAATPNSGEAVQTMMRRVNYHIDPTIVLRIEYLRGRLLPARPGAPPHFEDKRSFILQMDSATITLDTRGMAELLNRYVFSYSGAPLTSLTLTVEGDRLRQRGRLHGFPFSMLSEVSVTPAGELRLRPVKVKAFGIPVTGLMRLLGMQLEKMMNLNKAKGVRADHNDLLLVPTALLPPPLIRGHLAGVRLHDSAMVQIYRPDSGPTPPPLVLPDSSAVNFMYYRGSSLRFGKLTMTPADLLIVDDDPSDWFEFFLDRYNDQLVAGFSRNTPSGGLITRMPDLAPRQTPIPRPPIRR